MNNVLNLSVHQLIDFILRKGDIDNRIYNESTMSEGVRLHLFHQSKQNANYLSEYPLKCSFVVDNWTINLNGRADGIILFPDYPVIDEIKTTVADLTTFHNSQKEWHLGQAICYAFMFLNDKKYEKASIRLTYLRQGKDEKLVKEYSYTYQEIEEKVFEIVRRYISFYQTIFDHVISRNMSADNLKFPYSHFRKGQRDLSKYCYSIATNGGVMFSEAPTGIGKTISTLYPFALSFKDGENEKIFYLTAKNSGREASFQALEQMKKQGLDVKEIVITAKDKICFNVGSGCNPDECPFAKDYYSKLIDVLLYCFNNYSSFRNVDIIEVAYKFEVCPFELQLDLSLFVDAIICDYNYFFDPSVYLRRYFDEDAKKMLVLVDEAHNLVERGRDMYSASLSYLSFKHVKKAFSLCGDEELNKAVRRVERNFKTFKKENVEGITMIPEISNKLINALTLFRDAEMEASKNQKGIFDEDIKQFSMDVNKFILISTLSNSSYRYYVEKDRNELVINQKNLDPSIFIKGCMDKVKGTVLFSATLSPISYYIRMLGGEKETPYLILPSPFPRENLLLMVAPLISTRYKDREQTYEKVADYIKEAISKKVGNYLVFFPSYQYLERISPYFVDSPTQIFHVQQKEMSDEQKDDYLGKFISSPRESHIGLAVIGGAFSEGIDLVGDRLIGAIIVGVGLPQLSFERDIIKDYFDNLQLNGYDFSYVNPGMNRVMQAVGRVIRSEKERGLVLLIDDRYMTSKYRDLFKSEWNKYEVVTSLEDISNLVTKFFIKN